MSALCLLPDFSLLQTVKEIKCELPHLRNPEHDADDMNQDRPHVAKIYHGSAASTPIVPPMKQQTTTRICMIRFAAFPSRLSARIPADVDMDNAEDAAKRIRLMDAGVFPEDRSFQMH